MAKKRAVLQEECGEYHFLCIANISKEVRIHSFVRVFLVYREFKAMVLRLEEGDTEIVAYLRFSTEQVSLDHVPAIFVDSLLIYPWWLGCTNSCRNVQFDLRLVVERSNRSQSRRD